MLVCQITNACSITLTCQKKVVNIAVGRQGWLGNSLELLGQIGCWLSQSLVVFFPLTLSNPRNMPLLPTDSTSALPLSNNALQQKTNTAMLPAVKDISSHQFNMQLEISISCQPLCTLGSGDARDSSCPQFPVLWVNIHTVSHRNTHTHSKSASLAPAVRVRSKEAEEEMDKRNIQEAPPQRAPEWGHLFPLVVISNHISVSPTFHLMPSVYSHSAHQDNCG